MENIKCDLNIHLDNNLSEDVVKYVLELAQANKVQALSLMEYSALNLYAKHGVLYNLVKKKELQKVYTGKIIPGCEVTCVVNDTKLSRVGFNYNNHYVNLILLNFNIEKAEKVSWLNKKRQKKGFLKDVKTLIKMLKKLKLEVPKRKFFKFGLETLGEQLFNFYTTTKSKTAKKEYQNAFGEFYDGKTFNAEVLFNPYGKLYFKQKRYPEYTEVLAYAKEISARIYVAHPCHINKMFHPCDLVDALRSVKTKISLPIDGVEVYNFLNTLNETTMLHKFAVSRNLQEVGGSDYEYLVTEQNPEGKKTFVFKGQKTTFVPIPGQLFRQYLENGKHQLMLSKQLIDGMHDFREHSRFMF